MQWSEARIHKWKRNRVLVSKAMLLSRPLSRKITGTAAHKTVTRAVSGLVSRKGSAIKGLYPDLGLNLSREIQWPPNRHRTLTNANEAVTWVRIAAKVFHVLEVSLILWKISDPD